MAIKIHTDSKTLIEHLNEAIRMRQERLDRIFRENLIDGFAASANLFTADDPVGDFDSLTQAGYKLDLLTGSYRKEAR
jgi:hypothetical protein